MSVTVDQRRARLAVRHHLAGDADDPLRAATDLLAVHATDPASVYLSLLARCRTATIADIARVMYDERAMVRLMAMRRTLFVVPGELVPVVHHAAALDVAAAMRTRLVNQLSSVPTDPPIEGDVATWLDAVEAGVQASIAARGRAAAEQLSADEPRLRTALLPTSDKSWDVRRTITPQVLTLMAAEGRLVRAAPRGSWLARQHLWEPGSAWWPDGIAEVDNPRSWLVEAYLRRFGPATLTDVKWWTGWSLRATRAALAALDVVDTGAGFVLADDADPVEASQPSAALLPALDATAMGWKERDWYLPEGWRQLYDTNGNIGPTVWWGGEIIGGWAMRSSDGVIATQLLADRGKAAATAVAEAAEQLRERLDGAVVSAAFRTPLEQQLRGPSPR